MPVLRASFQSLSLSHFELAGLEQAGFVTTFGFKKSQVTSAEIIPLNEHTRTRTPSNSIINSLSFGNQTKRKVPPWALWKLRDSLLTPHRPPRLTRAPAFSLTAFQVLDEGVGKREQPASSSSSPPPAPRVPAPSLPCKALTRRPTLGTGTTMRVCFANSPRSPRGSGERPP